MNEEPLLVHVRGRIEASRVYEGVRYTRILTPAPDPYSKPAVLEVRSKNTLGARQDEISIMARLGGFTRAPFDVTDKKTGEVSRVLPVVMTLEVVGD